MSVTSDYRIYPWWPQNGNAWVHPDDVKLARRLIPSSRMFRSEGREGSYLVLGYGPYRIRVRPALRQLVRGDGFNVGDQVEVCSHRGRNRAMIATIREMRYDNRKRAVRYSLRVRGKPVARTYTAGDLRKIERPLAPMR
ncbi:MAG: hypothetical protein HYX69_10500 [Planctomycetia bacterium]|nr:hypothetical protein [Planctomycetia bacterium]